MSKTLLCLGLAFAAGAAAPAAVRAAADPGPGINVPVPALSSGGVNGSQYEHHLVTFSLGACSDSDLCRGVPVAETRFTYTWTIEQQGSNGQWYMKGDLDGSSTGANFRTAGFAPGDYRAVVTVDDTPSDGGRATGDDQPVTKHSGAFTLWPPLLTGFTKLEHVWADVNPKGGAAAPGMLTVSYGWGSTCGTGKEHTDHLNHWTVRETVNYDGWSGDDAGNHYWSHGGANCFSDHLRNPAVNGVPGTNGFSIGGDYHAGLIDEHSMANIVQPVWDHSYCQSRQDYDGAYKYPTAPEVYADGSSEDPAPYPGWATLRGKLLIVRGTKQRNPPGDTTIVYYITKDGEENQWPKPGHQW